MGEPANAERFIARYQQLLQRVQRRVAAIPDAERPGVVFENHAGMTGDTCCTVFGRSGFGQFIEAAGGRNLLADRVPDGGGDVNLEQLIAARPARYLLSGADWSQRGGLSWRCPGLSGDRGQRPAAPAAPADAPRLRDPAGYPRRTGHGYLSPVLRQPVQRHRAGGHRRVSAPGALWRCRSAR
ncbi:hypothetical protein O0544_18230 [Edwardsiella anguillarum]|nr:hypothetical protein [Edwardsiella anguillarum]